MESNGFKAKCPQIILFGVNEFFGSLLAGNMYRPSTSHLKFLFSLFISCVNDAPEVFGI